MVLRCFQDDTYGSSETALEQAIAYRDAVLAALPPTTRYEFSTKLKKNNRSGIAGVARAVRQGHGPYWSASIENQGICLKKRFYCAEHGEQKARALAIAQRQEWLGESRPGFFVQDAHAEKMATDNFGSLLGLSADPLPSELLTRAEFTTRLAEIDARFDARRPLRFKVVVTELRGGIFKVYVSDTRSPPKKVGTTVAGKDPSRPRSRRELPQVLALAKAKITAAIIGIHGRQAARWFMSEHGQRLLDAATFDRGTGVNVTVFLPPRLGCAKIETHPADCRQH